MANYFMKRQVNKIQKCLYYHYFVFQNNILVFSDRKNIMVFKKLRHQIVSNEPKPAYKSLFLIKKKKKKRQIC